MSHYATEASTQHTGTEKKCLYVISISPQTQLIF